MKIRAQVAMVLNLDKCIGCHTCSVTCKTVWISRQGMEYAWFNNVETKPGMHLSRFITIAGRHVHHVPRAGEDRERPPLADHRATRRHSQLGYALRCSSRPTWPAATPSLRTASI